MIKTTFDPTQHLRYVRYARMSTRDQNARSPEQQFSEIDRIIRQKNLPWVCLGDYRDDGISGRYKAKRPSFTRMIEAIKMGKVKVDLVLVDTVERFGRMQDLDSFRRTLKHRHGVLVLTADSGFADPTSFSGQALGLAEAFRATQDGQVKAHNVLRGKKDAAMLGHWPGGPAPVGYRLESVFKTQHGRAELDYSKLVPNPETAWLPKLMYELALTKGWGGSKIAKDLNRRPEVVAGFKRIHADTVNRILSNSIYRGELTFNDVCTDVIEDRRVIRKNPDDQIVRVPGFCEPLVSDDVWFKVHAVRKLRSDQIKKQRSGPQDDEGKKVRPLAAGLVLKYELSGLVRCAACGSAMRPNKGGGKAKNGKIYVYYMCPNHHSGSCSNGIYLPMVWLRQVVYAALRRRLFPPPENRNSTPDWFPSLVAEVKAELDRLREERQSGERPLLEREKADLNDRQQGWVLSLADRSLPLETRRILGTKLAEASGRIAQIDLALEALVQHERLAEHALDPAKVVACLHRLDEVLAQANPSATNVELARHIDRIEVHEDGRVTMFTCRLGAFEGLVEMLTPTEVETRTPEPQPKALEEPDKRVRARLLRRRAVDDLPMGSQTDDFESRRPEDPARFTGMGLNWFWQDSFQAPIHRPWYQEHAAEVQKVRLETQMSLEKLAKHFGKSKPTIIRALKYAVGGTAESNPASQ